MKIAAPMTTPAAVTAAARSPTPWIAATAWIAAYVFLAAFPILVLLTGKLPAGGGRVWDFAMAIGFGGLAIMGLQSVLTARFRRATAPFGVDIIYYFHRLAAIAGFALLAGHYLLLRLRYADALGPVDPRAASGHMTAGRLALLLFAALMVTSLWRKALRIEYDRWRVTHAVMAVAAVVLAIVHIEGVGHYTHAAWKGWVWSGFTVVWLLVLAYVRVVRPWNLSRTPYRVTGVHQENGHAWTVSLQPDGHRGLRFQPGQFAWLTLRSSPFRAKEHPFSFSGSAERAATLAFTIKELGDFTRTISTLAVGEKAYVDGPHGIFSVDRTPDAPGFVFVAGGVGIAPIMSMLQTLADRGDSRPLRLIYGNRRSDDVIFRGEIENLAGRLQLKIVWVLQEPPAAWTGRTGILDEATLASALPPETRAHEVFICGPKPMSDSVQRTLRHLGVPLHRIHCELFDMA